MTEFKGTKGEWYTNQISGIIIGVNAEIEKHKHGIYSKNVCEFILPDTDEEYEQDKDEIEANAKLISAAPDLLEALNFMINRFSDPSEYRFSQRLAIIKAKQAIKKATE